MNIKHNKAERLFQAAALLFAVIVMAAFPASALARSSGSQIDSAIAELAVDLATTLEGLGEDQVLIGTFSGPALMRQASAGVGIAKRLGDALGQNKITVSPRAKFAVQGSYKRVINTNGRVEIIIRGEFENNRTGQSFGEFQKVISAGGEANIENMANLFGVSASVPTNSPSRQREQLLLDRMQSPSVHIEAANKTRLRTSPDSPYAIEVLSWHGIPKQGVDPATLGYRANAISMDEGQAFVSIDRGDVYAIRIVNDSSRDAAVSLGIDGLSLFSFANQDHGHVILPRRSSAVIYGWYRTATHSDSFRVTDYADSAVSELGGSPDGIGIITVAFRQAWTEQEPIPDDEFAAKLLASRGANATGRGASVIQNYRPWSGHIGAIRNVISVRYSRMAKP